VIAAIERLPTEATSVLKELPPPPEFNIFDF
jgi:hypothetical protein